MISVPVEVLATGRTLVIVAFSRHDRCLPDSDAQGGSRTLTPLPAHGFEPCVTTVPPPGRINEIMDPLTFLFLFMLQFRCVILSTEVCYMSNRPNSRECVYFNKISCRGISFDPKDWEDDNF